MGQPYGSRRRGGGRPLGCWGSGGAPGGLRGRVSRPMVDATSNRLWVPRWRDSWYACHMREERATWKGSRHLGVKHRSISNLAGRRSTTPIGPEQLSSSSRVRSAARSLDSQPPAGQGSERWRCQESTLSKLRHSVEARHSLTYSSSPSAVALLRAQVRVRGQEGGRGGRTSSGTRARVRARVSDQGQGQRCVPA